jgi:hypothetical protein
MKAVKRNLYEVKSERIHPPVLTHSFGIVGRDLYIKGPRYTAFTNNLGARTWHLVTMLVEFFETPDQLIIKNSSVLKSTGDTYSE